MYKIISLFILLILVTGCSTNQTLLDKTSYQTGQASNQEIAQPKQTCSCRTDKYNCNDFKSRKEAREIYKCCMEKVGYDVHNLDQDKDGTACEW